MPHDAIATCPICSAELAVTRLHCRGCGTTLEGDFNVGRFARLSREQFALLESFLRSKGNLKEMERELGISYPTVRARVDALLRALGLGDESAADELDTMADTSVEIAGAAVLAGVLGALRVPELTVSARGLRYGILLECLCAPGGAP